MTTSTEQQTDPKQRILNAAIALFARKGFSATGVREIAEAADVNIAMISYYFGSKGGILEAAIDTFFQRYQRAIQDVFQEDISLEQTIRSLIRMIVCFFRKNADLARIVFTELPFDMPAIAEFKAKRIKAIAGLFEQQFLAMQHKDIDIGIVGPAIAGIVAFHFLQRPILKDVFGFSLDDKFYERYAEEIADLVLYGLHGKLEPENTDNAAL